MLCFLYHEKMGMAFFVLQSTPNPPSISLVPTLLRAQLVFVSRPVLVTQTAAMTKSVAPMAVAVPVWMQFVFPTIMSQINSVLIPVDSLGSVLLVAVVTMTVKTAKCAAPMDVVKLVLPALPSPSVAHTSDHSSMQLQWPSAVPGCPWVPTSHSVTLMGTTYLCSTMRGSPGVCTHRQGYLSLASTGGERWPSVEVSQLDI